MQATVTLVRRESVGPDTVALTFEAPAAFDGRPGQFVKFSGTVDGEEYNRFYTISSPNSDETFEVTVEVDESGGPFSAHLASLETGAEIEMQGPFGDDYYEDEPRAVVLAGGPGVGPAVAIAEAALDAGNDAAVVYQYDGTPAHEERLDEIRSRGADVYLTEGNLADAIDEVVTGDPDEQVFVYGFATFVDTVTDALEATGVDAGDAKVENFG